jgi:hypothetical protein
MSRHLTTLRENEENLELPLIHLNLLPSLL